MSANPVKRNRLAGIFGGLLVALLLIGPPFLAVLGIQRYRAAQNWPEAPCTMHETLQKQGRRGNAVYVLQYSYRVDGSLFYSDNYGLFASPNEAVKTFAESHPTGSTVPCFINPADPKDVVLVRDTDHIPWLFWVFPAIFAILWLLAAAYLVIWLINLREKSR